MNESKHTPGPWYAVGAWVEHPDDGTADICNCGPESMGQNHLQRGYEEICANARLISAAPDLLNAAILARDLYLRMFGVPLDSPVITHHDNAKIMYCALQDAINKAIGA